MPLRKNSVHGFTLIELLIVVAIIAILAAIAVPNFLEAQTRSKVSRAKSDMRSMATALEAYYVDSNAYPLCHRFGTVLDPDAFLGIGGSAATRILERITTPIAYMTSVVVNDPFIVKFRIGPANANALPNTTPVSAAADAAGRMNSYIYQSWNSYGRRTLPPDGFSQDASIGKSTAWLLHSAGPDSTYHNLGGILSNNRAADLQHTLNLIYDPTNGTVSFGSIYRAGGGASPSANYAAGEGLLMAIQAQR